MVLVEMSDRRELTMHRALADERRARIVEELDRSPDGLDVQELAERLGLHQNTVRWHLGILSDAGVLATRTAARSAPGRPRILYTLSPETTAGARDDYRLLATILTGTMATLDEGSDRAADAGRAWGRYLVPTPQPGARVSDEEATREVVELLDQQGFAARLEGDEIVMCRCPFAELATTHPGIVCTLHRGLIDGAFAELGSRLAVEELEIFPRPDVCVARVRR
jgi:predicted ArsR family transcriptional regulator